jgi:DNA ligase (NAD+)
MKMTANETTLKLREEVRKHKALYYAGTPEISDADYDELERRLRAIAPDAPELQAVGTPTDGKVRHAVPMQSQEKALNVETLMRFVTKHIGQTALIATAKMDGMSCSLLYEAGRFVRAATRGDGTQGEDITAKASHIPSIQAQLPAAFSGEVRGELVLGDGFAQVNAILAAEGKAALANKRNGVVGLINEDAVRPDKLGCIDFLAFELLPADPTPFNYRDQLIGARNLGFRVIPYAVATDQATIPTILADFRRIIDTSAYDMDGVVFRVDSHQLCLELGRTSHHPKYSVAYKYDAEKVEVTIHSIEWSVGTRDISPVAIFNPVELDGAKISRAGLHSVKNMRDIGARVGAVMTLTRQGQVIPWLQPFNRLTDEGVPVDQLPIPWPVRCPVCGDVTKLSADEAHLTCTSPTCSGKGSRQLEVFAKSVGLDWVGKSTALTLCAGGINTPTKLMRADRDALVAAGLTPAIADRLLESRAKLNPSKAQVLAGIGIPRVSTVIAKDLAAHFGTDGNDYSAGLERLGMAAAEATEYIEAHKTEILELLASMVHEDSSAAPSTEKPLDNLVICITGELSRPRKEVVERLEALGAKVGSAVSGSTDFLVCNDTGSTSSKASKARALGVKVLTEDELWKLVTERGERR